MDMFRVPVRLACPALADSGFWGKVTAQRLCGRCYKADRDSGSPKRGVFRKINGRQKPCAENPCSPRNDNALNYSCRLEGNIS
jgi:hypothetical protein